MFIDKKTATKIIEEISIVLNYDINIMGQDGLIIASTDKSRVNTFHEGASLILAQGLDELLIHYDGEYAGCHKGINLPIHLNDNIVGVVGITGDISEIISYGKIIKKMTEIIISDSFNYAMRNIQEKQKFFFITELLEGNFENQGDYFKYHLKKYNLDPDKPLCLALLKVVFDKAQQNADIACLETVSKIIAEQWESLSILAVYQSSHYLLLSNGSKVKMKGILDRKVPMIHEKLSSENIKANIYCFIGNLCESYEEIPASSKELLTAIHIINTKPPGVYSYQDLTLEITLAKVPAQDRENCVHHVFQGCTAAEKTEYSAFIIDYFQNNGSIKSISEKTFLHKNTVQYRISKILNKTGLDLRVSADLQILYMAAFFSAM